MIRVTAFQTSSHSPPLLCSNGGAFVMLQHGTHTAFAHITSKTRGVIVIQENGIAGFTDV
jgi:hypothetical protein